MFLLYQDKEPLLLPQMLGTCQKYACETYFTSQVSHMINECIYIVILE